MTHDLQTDRIRHALDNWSHCGAGTLSVAIRTLCDLGEGSWTEPGAQPGQTAATHLHEIDLFGVTATGDTPDCAARNWMRVARNSVAHVAA